MLCNGMLLLPEINTLPSHAFPSRALLVELVCESVGRVVGSTVWVDRGGRVVMGVMVMLGVSG